MLEAGTSLARALFFLQEKGLVHRDIRCRNVYVAEYTDKVNILKQSLTKSTSQPKEYKFLLRLVTYLPIIFFLS